MSDTSLTDRPAWKALQSHADAMRNKTIKQLFADDPSRGTRMTAEACCLFLDYSKNRITDETIKLLLQLAEESGLRQRIEAMFTGEKINITENRAVLHVALRAPKGESILWMVRMWFRRCMRCSTRCRRLRIGCAVGSVEAGIRESGSECDQHRHRRFGSWAGDGV